MTISTSRIRSAERNRALSLQWALPLGTYFAVWRQRRALARLSPENLTDMGITAAEASAEAARPFWDLPDMRRP